MGFKKSRSSKAHDEYVVKVIQLPKEFLGKISKPAKTCSRVSLCIEHLLSMLNTNPYKMFVNKK
jgi:hypothetical protein